MPNSQFVTNLIALKQNTSTPLTKSMGTSTTLLQKTLKKDLTDWGVLSRFFDELPSDILDKNLIDYHERYFISLFQCSQYPKAKTVFFIDRIILQAIKDLLNHEGRLYDDFITHMNLSKSINPHDEEKRTVGLISAYLVYFMGILASSNKPQQKCTKDHTRYALIMNEFNHHPEEHILDLIEKTRFVHALHQCHSNDDNKKETSRDTYVQFIEQKIVSELQESSLIKKIQIQYYWIDLMYISKKLGYDDLFTAIYHALTTANIKLPNNMSISLKYTLCKRYASNGHANNLKKIISSEHTNKKWQTSINALFTNPVGYQQQLSRLTTSAEEKIAEKTNTLQTALSSLHTALPHLKRTESRQESDSLITNTLRFFTSTIDHILFIKAKDDIKSLLTLSKQPTVSLAKLKNNAIHAQLELLTFNEDKSALFTQSIIELKAIQDACENMQQLGKKRLRVS